MAAHASRPDDRQARSARSWARPRSCELILLKLLGEHNGWTVRSLGDSLGIDPAGVHRALKRLEQAGLVDAGDHG